MRHAALVNSIDPPGPAIVWNWSDALRGLTYAVPCLAVAPVNLSAAAALAIGVLPAAALGIAPSRRARTRTVAFGALAGVSLFIGSLLAERPWLAVVVIFAACVGAALLAAGRPFGQVALALCLPLTAIGLSFSDLSQSAALAGLLVLGSAYAYLVSLPWPPSPAPSARAPGTPQREYMLGYGFRLGAAAAIAAALGFGLGFDHAGWACGAVLLVMRPSVRVDLARGLDRTVTVVVGALCAVGLVRADVPDVMLGAAAAIGVVAATATQRSRRYLTGTFTTFIVFLILLAPDSQNARGLFVERVGETVIGVGLAFVFGILLPAINQRRPTATAGQTV